MKTELTWNNVANDGLPPEETDVLLALPDDRVVKGFLSCGIWIGYNESVIEPDPTHWAEWPIHPREAIAS